MMHQIRHLKTLKALLHDLKLMHKAARERPLLPTFIFKLFNGEYQPRDPKRHEIKQLT